MHTIATRKREEKFDSGLEDDVEVLIDAVRKTMSQTMEEGSV